MIFAPKKINAFTLIQGKSPEALRAYLTKNPDEVESLGPYNRTPLIDCAYESRADMLKVVLEFKPNLNAQSNMGNTALHFATDRSHSENISLLLNAGAKTDILNNQGETAKDWCPSSLLSLFDKAKTDEPERKPCLKGEFEKQSDHIVSYTDPTDNPDFTITTLYNFESKQVIYISGVNGSAPNVKQFNEISDPHNIDKAAAFLEKKNGNLHGYKLNIIK